MRALFLAGVVVMWAALPCCGARGSKVRVAGGGDAASGGTAASTAPADGGRAAPQAVAGGGPYRALEVIDDPTVVVVDVPAAPAGPSGVTTQVPIEPDPCSTAPHAHLVWIEGVREGAKLAKPESWDEEPTLTVRCGRLIPHALILAPADADLALESRDSARHELEVAGLRVPLPIAGARVRVRVPGPGLHRVACALHGEEVAYVLGLDHPYAAVVSGERARIAGLPGPPRKWDVAVAEVSAAAPPKTTRRTVEAHPEGDESQ